MSDDGLRVCRECSPPHYENCETCFGFGVYDTANIRDVPLSASRLADLPVTVRPCPECGSTPLGIPRT